MPYYTNTDPERVVRKFLAGQSVSARELDGGLSVSAEWETTEIKCRCLKQGKWFTSRKHVSVMKYNTKERTLTLNADKAGSEIHKDHILGGAWLVDGAYDAMVLTYSSSNGKTEERTVYALENQQDLFREFFEFFL